MSDASLSSKEQSYLEWRRRDDPLQDEPWTLYLVCGGKDVWQLLNARERLELRGTAHEPPAVPASVDTFSFDGEGIYQMLGMTGQYVLTDAYRDVYAALQATKAERDRWWNAAQDRSAPPPGAEALVIEKAREVAKHHEALGNFDGDRRGIYEAQYEALSALALAVRGLTPTKPGEQA